MSNTHNATPIHKSWLSFLQKYQPQLSTLHGPAKAGKTLALAPKQLERARKEWLLELKRSGCRPHSWPTLPEEIGQLQQILRWRSLDMWHNVIGASKLSAHDPQTRPSSVCLSYQTWAKEEEDRLRNTGIHDHKATDTTRAKNVPTDKLPLKKTEESKSLESDAGTHKDKPRITILSPRLYGLTPNLFHRIWTSSADSSGLKDYALLKWRALMKEFYSMAKEYGERMEEVLRRIQSEHDVEKLLVTYDHYHQQLAEGVYKDWEQAISEWSEGYVKEKDSDRLDMDGDICEPNLASEEKFSSQREDQHDRPFQRHKNLEKDKIKKKKTSSTSRNRQSLGTRSRQFLRRSGAYQDSAYNSESTAQENHLFIRSVQQSRQSRARSGHGHTANIIEVVNNEFGSVHNHGHPPLTHDQAKAQRAKSAPFSDISAQRHHSSFITQTNPSIGKSPVSNRKGRSTQCVNQLPVRIAEGWSQTMSYGPPSSESSLSEGECHASMSINVHPYPLPHLQESFLCAEAGTISSRHITKEEEHHPESPFRDYSNLSLPPQLPIPAEYREPRKSPSIDFESIRVETANTSLLSVTDQIIPDDLLPPEIFAEIEAAYAEAGRIYADRMRRIDDVYCRMEEGNLLTCETETQKDVVEESDDSVFDTTESDIPVWTEDTGSDSDSSTPTPGSPVVSSGPLPSRFIELDADDEMPMNSQWTDSEVAGEHSGREMSFRWTAGPEIRLFRAR